MTNSHGRQKTPACGASLGARKTGHRPQQRLHSMWRGQVDCKAARIELMVTLRVLERWQRQRLNPVIFFAFSLFQRIEPVP